jgi:hypothetical protein
VSGVRGRLTDLKQYFGMIGTRNLVSTQWWESCLYYRLLIESGLKEDDANVPSDDGGGEVDGTEGRRATI